MKPVKQVANQHKTTKGCQVTK